MNASIVGRLSDCALTKPLTVIASPSGVVDGQCSAVSKEKEKMTDKSTSHHEGVDSQLRRLSAALTGGDATPSHLRLRRQKDSSASIEAIEMGLGTETEEPPFSQANTVHWDDGPTTQPAESDADAAKVVPAPEPECAPPIKRFMLSNNVDSQQDLSEMIVSLGGEVCSSSELDPSATHLLCAAPVRSEKMLGAVAAGKWALHPAYIARSRLHGAFLPEEEYEWGNPRALSLPPLSALEQAVARAAHRWRTARAAGRPGAFAGLRALLHMPPARRLLLSKLLRAGDGIVIDDVPPYSAEDVTLCLADFRRYPISERDAQWLRDRRVPVCPYILLFSYLTDEQPPDPKEHCLPEFRL
ncbi:DNA topoisomerase 2-binding protein 1 [Eumeta japonica]|uniref:DNA topoisomerase 2-binding protein 1 n=1 Tax=Eumeta variegata TaxID=151549 RepID=A0A4C1XTE8_EUMVA|nr:DNA topoisomerase 2-binding protein 1 [Eumeta japonica]